VYFTIKKNQSQITNDSQAYAILATGNIMWNPITHLSGSRFSAFARIISLIIFIPSTIAFFTRYPNGTPIFGIVGMLLIWLLAPFIYWISTSSNHLEKTIRQQSLSTTIKTPLLFSIKILSLNIFLSAGGVELTGLINLTIQTVQAILG
jgi:hypothetical protein